MTIHTDETPDWFVPPTEGEGRLTNDAYYTPLPLAQMLVSLLPIQPGQRILEPSVGLGAFPRALRKQVPDAQLYGVDIEKDVKGFGLVDHYCTRDFIGENLLSRWPKTFHWTIGNPPFTEAQRHAERAMGLSRHVAFLLRLGFLASDERVRFWDAHPARIVWSLSQRPREWPASFDYAFYWWDRNYKGKTELRHLSWR